MTYKELYELFETDAKIIIQFLSKIEISPLVKEKGFLATIIDMKVDEEKERITIIIDTSEFVENGNVSELHFNLNDELNDMEVISNTLYIKEYKNSGSTLSYQKWLEEKIFGTNTITLEVEVETYEKLQKIAEENHTTIEKIINNLLELCIKENGLVIWKDGFDKPYIVLKTRKEVQEYLNYEN